MILYLEGEFIVNGGHLGGHVNGGRRVYNEVFDRLVPVALSASHQVEDELEKDLSWFIKVDKRHSFEGHVYLNAAKSFNILL